MTMTIAENILLLALCHVVGDFLFQNRYLAETKGSNWYHLFVHCLLYMLPFYIAFGWFWQLGIIGVVHLIVDAAKARYKVISYATDQALHYLTLLIYLI